MGLCLAIFSKTSAFDIMNNAIDKVFFDHIIPAKYVVFRTWIYAVLGSTVAGWGTFIYFISAKALSTDQKWGWNALFFASLVWYIPDTFFSFKMGVFVNVWLNSILLMLLTIPLIIYKISKNQQSED